MVGHSSHGFNSYFNSRDSNRIFTADIVFPSVRLCQRVAALSRCYNGLTWRLLDDDHPRNYSVNDAYCVVLAQRGSTLRVGISTRLDDAERRATLKLPHPSVSHPIQYCSEYWFARLRSPWLLASIRFRYASAYEQSQLPTFGSAADRLHCPLAELARDRTNR